MSPTLDQLVAGGWISPWVPELGPRRLPQRRLFVTKEFEKCAMQLGSDRQYETLLDYTLELQTVAADFVAGERIVTFMRRVDPPKGEGLMRISTTSLRLIGWCPAPQTLILAIVAKAKDTHGGGKLTALGKDVVKIRREMGVTEWAKGEYYELFQYQG